jgi:2-polyprenyl-3-methyl-5-hydroxy-6-metoxy-1,4-benzoquinol methylase
MVDIPAGRSPVTGASEVDVMDDSPERFDPAEMQGRLIEAEHMARYEWVTALVPGKRVLDAGCGTAYGSNILARAGADEVVGVDIDGPTIERASESVEDVVALAVEDVHQMSFADASFEIVVFLEVLEHVEKPLAALDELARVLAPAGVLVVSSPNPGVYPPGNPHHLHEFKRSELTEALEARLQHVRVIRQHAWLASSIVEDAELRADEGFDVRARSTLPDAAEKELYSIALASNAELPSVPPHLVVTDTADLKWWQERVTGLQEDLRASHHRAARVEHESETERARSRGVAKQLLATETKLARQLEECAIVESELADTRDALRQREKELEQREQQLAEMEATRAWRFAVRYWGARSRVKRMLGIGR